MTTLEKSSHCIKCRNKILDKYYLQTKDGIYHVECLRCDHCNLKLDGQLNCYNRSGRIYCKNDYERLFHQSISICFKCGLQIKIGQFIQRVNSNKVFHLECFKCSDCESILQPGQQYTLKQTFDQQQNSSFELLCERHFIKSNLQISSTTSIKGRLNNKQSKECLDQKLVKNKRNRTSFKLSQMAEMKAYFEANKNPDTVQLNQLAEYTGLQPRVLRNMRAKVRRNFLQQKSIGPLIVPEETSLKTVDIKLLDEEQKEDQNINEINLSKCLNNYEESLLLQNIKTGSIFFVISKFNQSD